MAFRDDQLKKSRPDSIRQDVRLPRRQSYFPSPMDWRDEVLYFLLVDRFSDGRENKRKLLNRGSIKTSRPENWRWDAWAESGADRWQGGNLRGVRSKLSYLQDLGITTLWLSPVFKQRGHENSYHGYGIQDFLDVDPHFGTRKDLVDLVKDAHKRGMRIILDVIFNHSGPNWIYPEDAPDGRYMPRYTKDRYRFGNWLGVDGQPIDTIQGSEDGVWPVELQNTEEYTRAGSGDLGAGDLDDPNAEHKRTDFYSLRDFSLSADDTLANLALCYKYWIALTDCDGFRMDTLKHVSFDEARRFCGTIKEFAANLGKYNFYMVGEVAGGDFAQDRYLDVLERNLDAALDIGEKRVTLTAVARGLAHPTEYFEGFDPGLATMGSHRNLANKHVSILNDHDHVFGEKLRFSVGAVSDHQVVVGVAIQLLTLGVPCIYYGTEQAFSGPEPEAYQWIPYWGASDRYLRETMFGADHPRQSGRAGIKNIDENLPGFGAFGTVGVHCFDPQHPAYVRISALAAARRDYHVLRHGRQYLRPVSIFGGAFEVRGPGELIAWSRILDDEEAICIVNAHGLQARGANILVDSALNPPGSEMMVIANTAQAERRGDYTGTHPVGSLVPVLRSPDGIAYMEIRDVGASEALVLVNHPL